MRVPSPPPPRRLSRSSIDLRDLELQHEKISHTDSAPSMMGIDRYLKSSDSEPLQFQQQLRQQLKFQEQIQQQYYLGSQTVAKRKPTDLLCPGDQEDPQEANTEEKEEGEREGEEEKENREKVDEEEVGLMRLTVASSGRGGGRRRSSSCEEIRVGTCFGWEPHEEAKCSDVVREEEVGSVVLWRNFANKSRFGSSLKKFNSSSRLLVGSFFGDRSTPAKYRHLGRNRGTMWSMEEPVRDFCDSDGGAEAEQGVPEEKPVDQSERQLLRVQTKRSDPQRMRVFSDGHFEEHENQLQKKKRPRVLSEGHESHSDRGLATTATRDTPDILLGLVDEVQKPTESERVGQEETEVAEERDDPLTKEKVLLMDMSEEEQRKFLQQDRPCTETEPKKEKLSSLGNLSLVDQELLRALSNVTPEKTDKGAAKKEVPVASKPEIVMDSTLSEGLVGGPVVSSDERSEGVPNGDKLCVQSPGKSKSPSALLKRDENGMRLRQASVVTYDVNVINFRAADELSVSDNFNYNGHGSFSSAAGQSNLHNGRHSTSSASKLVSTSPLKCLGVP